MPLTHRVLLTNEVPQFQIHRGRFERFVQAILRRRSTRRSWVSFIFVSDAKIRRLNQRHLNHPHATDVLAFPFSLAHSMRNAPRFLGEVIISPKRADVQARRFGVPFDEELRRYVCHGLLHLLGSSDNTDRARRRMRAEEDQFLRLNRQGKGGMGCRFKATRRLF